jgi:hypothetical protein
MSNRFITAACLLALLSCACSRSVRVSPSDYDNPGSAAAYRIVTVDDRHFSASRYSASDSTIVIEEFAASQSANADSIPDVPFVIPLRDVESIDRVTLDRGKASGWVFGAGVAFLVLAILAASAQVM